MLPMPLLYGPKEADTVSDVADVWVRAPLQNSQYTRSASPNTYGRGPALGHRNDRLNTKHGTELTMCVCARAVAATDQTGPS